MSHIFYVNWQNCSSYATIQECAALTCTLSGSAKTCPTPTVYPNIPYELNAATGMCVRNLPETYELKLTPDAATLEPGKTYSFTATVTKVGGGAPSQPVPVSVKVEVDPTSGGHDHGEKFAKRSNGTVTPSTENTVLPFTFTATAASGKHTITATCEQCVNKTATATVKVMVEGLEPIPDVTYIPKPDASFYTLVESNGSVIGATSEHKDKGNHYLTPEAAKVLLFIAATYSTEVKYWKKTKGMKPIKPLPLHLNDASLVWGGKFDVFGGWKDKEHAEHKRGTVIDIRANSKTGAIPLSNFAKFIELADFYGADAGTGPHASGTDHQHFHIRLLGKGE